jgi:hypothetical protein
MHARFIFLAQLRPDRQETISSIVAWLTVFIHRHGFLVSVALAGVPGAKETLIGSVCVIGGPYGPTHQFLSEVRLSGGHR